jgi:hypothetical protein
MAAIKTECYNSHNVERAEPLPGIASVSSQWMGQNGAEWPRRQVQRALRDAGIEAPRPHHKNA